MKYTRIRLFGILLILLISLLGCGKKNPVNSECRKLADSHWSRDEYTQWLIDSLAITADTMRYFDPVNQEWGYLSHHLPDSKTEEYYEMIGIYDQFRWGWDDYSDATKTSENRNTYLECLK